MSTILSRLFQGPKSLFAGQNQGAARRTLVPRTLVRRRFARQRTTRLQQRLFLEPLEDRRLLATDLSITKLASQEPVIPGARVTYTIQVSNLGSESATAAVADTMPAALNSVSFNSSAGAGVIGNTASGTGNILDNLVLPAGSSVTYTVTGTVSSSATGSLSNTATVTPTGSTTDTNMSNNSATAASTLTPQADLSIMKVAGVSDVAAGGNLTYTIIVTNSGPSAVTGATISDTMPAAFTNATFTSSGAGGASGFLNGSGNLNQTVNLPVGATIVYTVNGTVSASATGGITNTANIAAPAGMTEINAANDTAINTLNIGTAATSQADLSITKSDAVSTVAAGGTVAYTIVVTNNGPTAVSGATVSDNLAASILGATFTATGTGGAAGFANGSGNINQVVNLPVGATITYLVTAPVSASANGSVSNIATVTAPSGVADLNTTNNVATDTDLIGATGLHADLSITKTNGVSTVAAGGNATYTIVVTNNGPSAVVGATVNDTLAANLTGATFTAAGSGGASGFANGIGNLNQTVNLPVGASITYTLSGTLSPSAAGSLSNIAMVTAPAGVADVNPSNNIAVDTDAIGNVIAQTDLSITKTDNVTNVAPGGHVTYTIVVRNNGTAAANGATVVDTLSSSLTGASFTATATGGATGFTNGSGNINQTVNLPAGSTITYTVAGTLSAQATGSLSNTATITAPAGTGDTNPANNIATDTDTIGTGNTNADLSVTKTDHANSVSPGGNLTYTIMVHNNGPTAVTGATVVDTIGSSLTNATFTATSTGGATGFTPSGTGSIADTVTLPNGGTITYTVHAAVSNSATGSITNTATVTAPAGIHDTNLNNNTATDTDTIVVTPIRTDLRITKTDNATSVTAGGQLSYVIVVTNAGPSAVTGATVSDTLSSLLMNSTFTATATGGANGFTTSGSGDINDIVNLPAGSTVTYLVQGTVSQTVTGTISNTATITAPAGVTDTNLSNNTATDTDFIGQASGLPICNITTLNLPAASGTAAVMPDLDNSGQSVLLVTGTSKNDNILIDTRPNGQIRVTMNGHAFTTFAAGTFQRIIVYGQAGNDTITVSSSISAPAVLFGGDGNDRLTGGSGNDQLSGGSGNDTLSGGNGNDILCGDSGNDSLSGGNGNDLLFGEDGNDRLSGDAGNDELLGGAGNDNIDGGAGNDILFGEAGNDDLRDDSGNNIFVGGSGNDQLRGGNGRDILIGGDGHDDLRGGGGDDVLIGGSTAFDANDQALQAIMSEWSSNGSYATRVSKLENGGGANGSFLLGNSTLTDDNVQDQLRGESGQDLFFAGVGDGIKDKGGDEHDDDDHGHGNDH